MANLKIPYTLVPAVVPEMRRANMVTNIARPLPRLRRSPLDVSRTLYVACYGPSLRETWEELRGKSPIIAMSGATKFLAERGIQVDYALEMDPRVSQLTVSLPAVPGVTYLVASCVLPEFFDRVLEAGNPVILWHTVSTTKDEEQAFVDQHDPGEQVVHGGSTVGLSALHIGGILGFSRFVIHGMDGSFAKDGERHAGFHGGKTQRDDITWDAGGVTYRTSQIMANAVAESVNTAKNFPIVTIWHGDGLTQALIREANLRNAACADETEKVARLLGARPPAVPGQPGFWEMLLTHLQPGDLPELVQHIAVCEPRRVRARYNTGTVPFEAAAYLRALCRRYTPPVIVEVGTFIGTSTLALQAAMLYTCDERNDCFPATSIIRTYPYQSSTQMLEQIHEPVDLFFFDGRIRPEDLPHIQRLMTPTTVFVVDDYVENQKGVANVQALASSIPLHTLIPPSPGPSTLAVMVPARSDHE